MGRFKKHKKAIKIKPTCEYPCQWDDLIDSRNKPIATIYTLKEGIKDNKKTGITKGENGICDIVVDTREINNEVVRNALKDLEKAAEKRYIFAGSPSPEDEIIAYAERLMKPLIKYGDHEKGFNFTKARTPKEKTEVIGIWLGEILYDALTYKDDKSVKSLIKTILTEIEDLMIEKTLVCEPKKEIQKWKQKNL